MQPKKGNTVTQHNELIEASYKMTYVEKRFLLLGISRVNPMRKAEAPLEFFITADHWHEAYPDDPTPWRSLRRGAKGLLRRFVTFRDCGDEWDEMDMAWLDVARYKVGQGMVRIRFGAAISEFLSGDLDRFTSIPLLELEPFSSIHAIRLYASGACLFSLAITTGLRPWLYDIALPGLFDRHHVSRGIRICSPRRISKKTSKD